MSGPKLQYEGNQAGLKVGGSRSGDRSNPFDYTLYCSCTIEGHQTNLGPLGRFSQNETGQRTAYCPNCSFITVVTKDGAIYLHAPFKDCLTSTKKG